MAKKARKSQGIASLSVDALFKLRDDVSKVLSAKAAELQAQLARLGGDVVGNGFMSKRRGRPPGKRGALKGTKVAPKYRSKKDPKLTWSGRGAMASWMKAEMKGTKLKKDDFLIKKAA